MDKRDKDNALRDYLNMCRRSWTWERMSEKERKNFLSIFQHGPDGPAAVALRGSYLQRWNILQAIYSAFLSGLGYTGGDWRETDPDAPQF